MTRHAHWMKGSHQCADLKQLYAKERGLALRTAQLHAKQGHADWVAFIARTAGRAVRVETPTKLEATALVLRAEQRERDPSGDVTGIPDDVGPPAMSKPKEQRTTEEWAECEAWDALVQAHEQRRLAMRTGDPMAAAGFVRIANDAIRAYHLARSKRVAADIEAGRLKPVAAWHQVRSAVAKIAALIANLEEIAAAANPDNPLVARRAITDWRVNRFGPEVERLIADVQTSTGMAA